MKPIDDPTPFGTRSKLVTIYASETRQIRQGGDPFPVALEVNLSNFCGQNCGWCISANVRNGGWFLNLQRPDVEKFFRDFKKRGGRCVTWSGGGEPTDHPRFVEAVSLLSDIGLPQGLMTHGAFRSRLVQSIASRCAWVRVSVDTHDPVAYARRRHASERSFPQVLDNVRALVNAGATVGMNMNVAEWNKHHIRALYELACALGCTYLQVRPTLPRPFPTGDTDDDLKPSSIPAILDQLAHLQHVTDDANVTRLIVSRDKFDDLRRSDTGRTYPGCKSHRLFLVLNCNGDLSVCMYHLFDQRFVLGNIFHKDLDEIWLSNQRRRVLNFCERRIPRGLDHVLHQCQVCCKGHEINKVLAHSDVPELEWPSNHADTPFL